MKMTFSNSSMKKMLSIFLSAVLSLMIVMVPLSSITKVSAGTTVTGSTVSGISSYIYVPSSYKEGTAVPLYVSMHGCTQSYSQFATSTNINALAEEKGFIVLHLQQSSSNNTRTCFTWFSNQSRTGTEPKAIISIINDVKSKYTIDDDKVFCFGFSAGAAMAHLLCACYPDVFAGGGIGAGLAFKSATILNYSSAMSSGTSVANNTIAGYIVSAMSGYERVIPMIVFHGTSDAKVNVKNGAACTMSWVLAMNQIGADINTTPTKTSESNYNVESYVDSGTGKTVVKYYTVTGMDHAWSGGKGSSYAYASGPDATRIMYDFFEEYWDDTSSETPDTAAPITTVNPVGGNYTEKISVTFSVNEAATTYYTTDGTEPTASSEVYDKPFEISSTTTVKYFSVDKAGNSEKVNTVVYNVNIDTTAPTTTVTPDDGSYTSEITVSFSTDEAATTYYTTDGTEPTTSSEVYDEPFSISSTTTLKFFSVDAFGNKENIKTVIYNIDIPVVDTVAPVTTVTPGAGVYYEPVTVTLSVNENATTYYTTDGTEPTIDSDVYTGAFVLDKDATVKYFSVDESGNCENVKSVSYIVITGDVKGTSVDLTIADREAKIYISGRYRDGMDMPLIVMLHGDGQTAEQFELLANMNELADSEGFIVLYLSADSSNPLTSWKWYDRSVQTGSGDTAYIVDAINAVNSTYSIDDNRIYAVGFGAGAAMANIVAVTNPGLIEAIAVASGTQYAAAGDLNSSFNVKQNGGNASGQSIVDVMGTNGDVTPVIVIHGENDQTFSIVNAENTILQWADANDILDNGTDDDSVSAVLPETDDFSGYSKYVYSNTNGLTVMEKYVVNGMGYAWSGGNVAGDYAYTSGPSASEMICDFFSRVSGLDYYVEPEEIDVTAPVTSVNPDEGTYQNSVTVSLSVNEEAITYYTIDGTTPAVSSPVYTTPLTFTETTTLKFFSVDESGNVENVKTKVYTVTVPQTVTTSISYDKSLSGYAGTITYFGYGTDVVKAGLAGLYNGESFRGIVSFDTSGINTSAIESAVLRFKVEDWGSSVNSLSFDIVNGYFGNSGIQLADFSATAGKTGIATATPISSGYLDIEIPASVYEYLDNHVEFRICSTVTNGFSESVVTFSDAILIVTSTNVTTYSLRKSSANALSDTITFGDENLKNALIAAGYDTDSDGEISRDEITKIYGIDLSNIELTSIEGLEYAVNLKYIDLSNNVLTSIDELESCSKLQYVNVSNNSIDSIDVFADASDMLVLVADNNSVSSINGISMNDSIVYLSVAGNIITDISALKNMKSLRSVNMSGNKISDITSLSELVYINYTHFADNKVESLDAISELGYLFEADFSKNYLDLAADGDNAAIVDKLLFDGTEISVDEQKPNGTINSVTYVVDGEKIIFTVTTSPDYNRVKVTTSDNLSGYIKYTSASTADAQGNTVYTLTVPAVVGTTKYAFDGRLSATGLYESDYYYIDVTVEAPEEPEEIFKSASYEIKDGKVTVTVVTSAGDFNRVKISLPSAITKYVKYTDKYTVNADGDYVWTLKFNAPEAITEYALDVRVISTSKYVKDYYYVTIDPTIEPETAFVSGTGELVNGKLSLTIVTKPTTINRVKVMLTSDQSSYVKLIDKYTVNADGNYVWTTSIAAPSETTSYTCDVRSTETNRYMKDFYTFDVEILEQIEVFKSVSYEIKDDKIIFTVVTIAGDYNRIKVTTPDNLGGSLGVGSYTVNENGDYVWTIKATAPTESMSYAFDIRSAETGKYFKDYHIFDVTVEAKEEIIKSASHEIKGDKIYFTVVTSAGSYERIKATTADNLGGSLGIGATYTVNENGDFVWVFKVAAPTQSTSYAFDIRSSETGKYLKDYFIYEVVI